MNLLVISHMYTYSKFYIGVIPIPEINSPKIIN